MTQSGKTFCQTHYRHLRLLFLVDDRVSERFLIDLFMDNYKRWGGRYNPVIPVHNGTLSPYYQSMMMHFDPDIVFYSEQVGIASARLLSKNLYPKELMQLEPDGHTNFPGVYAHHLLPSAQLQARGRLRPFSLVYFERHQEDPQTSFYNLSFGITNRYAGDDELGSGYPTAVLDVTNISETNRQIAESRPFFNVLLAEQQVESNLFSPTNNWEFNCLEFIIYDEGQPFEDLIYFWNRASFQQPTGEIRQIIASRPQFALLITDPNFGGLLRLVARNSEIYLHSLSIGSEELESNKAALQAACPGTSFRIATSRTFPRIMRREDFPYQRQINKSKNLLLGKRDHLRLPAPAWRPDLPLRQGTYIYDAEFFEEDGDRINYLKLPYGTVVSFLLGPHDARVNKEHHVSFFVNPEKQGLDIDIPTGLDIFRSRLRARTEFGELVNPLVEYLDPSDAGLKLASFINLFDGQLRDAGAMFEERFWIDIVLGQSTAGRKKTFQFKRIKSTDKGEVEEPFTESVSASNIYNHDGSFSYLDLKGEQRLIYLENADGIRAWLHDTSQDDDQLLAFMRQSVGHDLQYHIDPYLQYLVDRDALFIGMKVKCPHCGSNSWYPLAELKNKMSCKGCLQTIIPAVQSHLYYRFNDVIHNNISSDPIKRAKTYHGNYIVMRTLAFYEHRHNAYQSFFWAPSMDIGIQYNHSFVKTDIDIAMIRHGKLCIGEAKASASDFSVKQFEQLRIMAEIIRPDELMLAWHNGTINPERLEQLKLDVALSGCEVITHRVEAPSYYFGHVY